MTRVVKIKLPAELVRIVTEGNVYPQINMKLALNGKPLHLINDETHKVTSDLFNFTLPKDNIWEEPEGPDKGITQGWWIMLKPLPPGEHTLHYTTGYSDSRSDPQYPPWARQPHSLYTGRDISYYSKVIIRRDNELF